VRRVHPAHDLEGEKARRARLDDASAHGETQAAGRDEKAGSKAATYFVGAAAAGAYGYADPCLRQQQVYDIYGNIVWQTVRVC
jgi:hypothetical protein